MSSTASKVAKLKDMAGKAGQSVYERLGLAIEVLSDNVYVAAHYGDESKALEVIESDMFGDLCGARSLSELLEVRRTFPQADEWKQHKWNLSRLLAEWDEKRRAMRVADRGNNGPVLRNSVTVKQHEDVKQKLAEFQHIAKRNAETVDDLRDRIRELERENIALRAKNEELERLLGRSLERASA